MQPIEGHPLVVYPCIWTYRVICTDEQALSALVVELVTDAEYALTHIGASASGIYQRFELVVNVRDEAQRNAIFAGLGRAPFVRFVV